MRWSRYSRRIEPIARSTYGLCQGERGAITTSAMSITATRLLKTSSVRGVAIAQKTARSRIPRERFSYLRDQQAAVGCCVTSKRTIFRRSRARMSITNRSRKVGDGTMNMSIAAIPSASVAEEAAPSRRWRAWPAQDVLGNRRLTDLDTELEQLAMYARRTPELVGIAHLADQPGNVVIYRSAPWRRPPAPVEPKALPVPLDHGGWLHQHDDIQTARPTPDRARPTGADRWSRGGDGRAAGDAGWPVGGGAQKPRAPIPRGCGTVQRARRRTPR